MFIRYQHIETFGKVEVIGIELGKCFVFPKLDGANGCVWAEKHDNNELVLMCASRRRTLSNPTDLEGFYRYAHEDDRLKQFLIKYSNLRLFGEWLVPHTFRGYQEDAWRKFYVFDVAKPTLELGADCQPLGLEYLPYLEYQTMLEEFSLDYVPCIKIINNGTPEKFLHEMRNNNTYLVKQGYNEKVTKSSTEVSPTIGEGIVIKNYDYRNRFGRQCFAKMKTNEFVAKHNKVMGPAETGKSLIEVEAATTLARDVVMKEYELLVKAEGSWRNDLIPRLLETVWHTFIIEEIYHILKKFKYPIINFKLLQKAVQNEVKKYLPEIFGGS